MKIRTMINGRQLQLDIEPHELLLDVLRERLGLTGTKASCMVQVCGACAVLLDGEPISSCCYPAFEIADREVLTVEGLRDDPTFAAIEIAFVRHAAVQCGYCIPGMATTLKAAIDSGELQSWQDVVDALRGNLCRCTGYRAILYSACEVAGVTPP